MAYLIDRTPAAVSRAFANIWAAMTHGREGLANNSALCRNVVSTYRTDQGSLHREALLLRDQFLSNSLAPRIELRTSGRVGLFRMDLKNLAFQASRATGVPRRMFVLYRRTGSVVEGALLVLFGALASPLGERFVKWVEAHLESAPPPGDVEVVRTQTWIALRDGRLETVDRTVISHYLPTLRDNELDVQSRRNLAGHLAHVLGVGKAALRAPVSLNARQGTVGVRRRKEMEKQTGAKLGRLSRRSLKELDYLLKVVNTKGFRKAAKELKQMKLEDFGGGE